MKREILTDDEMMDKYGDWKILRVYATSNSSRCGYRMTEEDGKKGYSVYYESSTGRHYERWFHPGENLGILRDVKKIPNMKDYIESFTITDGNETKEFYKNWKLQKYVEETE